MDQQAPKRNRVEKTGSRSQSVHVVLGDAENQKPSWITHGRPQALGVANREVSGLLGLGEVDRREHARDSVD